MSRGNINLTDNVLVYATTEDGARRKVNNRTSKLTRG